MTPNVLDTRENIRLSELEKAISKGQKQFVAVGLALAEIRDAKLYRGDFKTFAEYCETKWGFKRSYAYQMIESAGVAVAVSAIADISNEAQARELARVAPEQRAEVLAAAGPTPTARSIREAAAPPVVPAVVTPAVPAEVPTPPATQAAPEASHSPQPQGMTLARKAVEMLERIASDDPQRDDALDHVQAWLRHHRQKGNH
jgi:hypothetical protein